jgi:hypothetical protein
MKLNKLIEQVDETEGDLTFIKLESDCNNVQLLGVCPSTEDLKEMDLPKGKYLILRAIEILEL